ncbi:MAG: radical SAM protein [Halanaerobiaceae bacterium]|nr:radical SAM protein [Halanaerobiaceae bacterium]
MHEVIVKGILSANNGMNIYRGCTHGCIYCDSRSKCYQMNHDFEDIEVKVNAPELLEKSLSKKRKKCMISTGSMSDPYIPLEKELQYTRKCLEIIYKYSFGLAIQTKSDLILRDLDLLKGINERSKCVVQITMTTYDESLCKKIEPDVSTTRERFDVLKLMRDNGIPTVVWLSPILPFINDNEENIKGILDYCIEAEVKAILCFGMGMTLRAGNREYFYQKLDDLFPGLKERYIRKYADAYHVVSPRNKELMNIITVICKRNRILLGIDNVFEYIREFKARDEYEQLRLF